MDFGRNEKLQKRKYAYFFSSKMGWEDLNVFRGPGPSLFCIHHYKYYKYYVTRKDQLHDLETRVSKTLGLSILMQKLFFIPVSVSDLGNGVECKVFSSSFLQLSAPYIL